MQSKTVLKPMCNIQQTRQQTCTIKMTVNQQKKIWPPQKSTARGLSMQMRPSTSCLVNSSPAMNQQILDIQNDQLVDKTE